MIAYNGSNDMYIDQNHPDKKSPGQPHFKWLLIHYN